MAKLGRLCNHGFWHTTSDLRPLEKQRRHRSEWRESIATQIVPPYPSLYGSYKHSSSMGHLLIDDDQKYKTQSIGRRPFRGNQSVRFADGANTIHRFSADSLPKPETNNGRWWAKAADLHKKSSKQPNAIIVENGDQRFSSYSTLQRPFPQYQNHSKQRRSIADVYSIPINGYHRLGEPTYDWNETWRQQSNGQTHHQNGFDAESSRDSHDRLYYAQFRTTTTTSNQNEQPISKQPVRLRRFYDQTLPYNGVDQQQQQHDDDFFERKSSRRSSSSIVRRFIAHVRNRFSSAMDRKRIGQTERRDTLGTRHRRKNGSGERKNF